APDSLRLAQGLLVELGELRMLRGRAMVAKRLQREPDEGRDDDEREERAAEEAIHVVPAEGTSGMTLERGGRTPGRRAFEHQGFVEDADVREVPVALGEVEPVADDEPVRDLEARVADGHVDLAPLRLRQECADL